MTTAYAIRVFNDNKEIAKEIFDDATIIKEGIISVTSVITATYDPGRASAKYTITVPSAVKKYRLIMWSEDEVEDGYEYQLMTYQKIGNFVATATTGVFTFDNTAAASVNNNATLLCIIRI